MFKDYYVDDWKLNIIDNDFEEDVVIHHRELTWGDLGYVIIDIYQKRNLNVAANFVLYLKHIKEYGWEIRDQIKLNIRDNLLYKKYETEIEKYLLLLE
jgi:hypothetical protein